MRASDRTSLLLADLDDLLAEAAEFVARGRSVYEADKAMRRACEAVCIHVGEIAKRLVVLDPERFADDIWSAAARNRDLLAHHYDRVAPEQLWATMSTHLPALALIVTAARKGSDR